MATDDTTGALRPAAGRAPACTLPSGERDTGSRSTASASGDDGLQSCRRNAASAARVRRGVAEEVELTVGVVVRFGRKIAFGDGCWEWRGSIASNGYGVFYLRRHPNRAHRIAWMIANGRIPAGMLVCHRCDNPRCVRPDHLFLGTTQDNTADMVKKGRAFQGEPASERKRGTLNPRAKLDDDAIGEIVTRYRSGGVRQKDLAKEYSVSQSTINGIIRGNLWTHVEAEHVRCGKGHVMPQSIGGG